MQFSWFLPSSRGLMTVDFLFTNTIFISIFSFQPMKKSFKMLKKILLTLVLAPCFWNCSQKTPIKDGVSSRIEPIYATYAAAMDRSQYLIDQGYEFHFYKGDQPLKFFSQKGGQIGLVFKVYGGIISEIDQYFRQPSVHESFPDMASFSFQPVEDLKAKGEFFVFSSTIAVQQYEFVNTGTKPMEISLIPFFQNEYRSLRDLQFNIEYKGFHFFHEKYPDGWSVNQQIPYADSLQSFLIFSEAAQDWAFLNASSGKSAQPDFGFLENQNSKLQVYGRAYDKKERLAEPRGSARILVSDPKNPKYILTENSPVWGLRAPAIDEDGLFRIELGNFPQGFTLENLEFSYFNHTRSIADRFSPGMIQSSKRIDFHASDSMKMIRVSEIEKDWTDSVFSFSWEPSPNAESYLIYQRNYPNGYYELVAEVQEAKFQAQNVAQGGLEGYVVLPKGDFQSIHSEEILNVKDSSLDLWLAGEKSKEQPLQPSGMAAEFDFMLQPGESKTFSIVRGIGDHQADSDSLYRAIMDILPIDFEKYKAENRSLFAKVAAPKEWDKDTQWLYKSAWNMMRQVMMPAEGKAKHNYYLFSREPTWGWGHGGQVFHESITMLAYAYLDPQSAMNSQRIFSERQYENGYINYRTGPFLDEIIEYNSQLTSSAPWFNWLNWEIYLITKDRQFLQEMYASGKMFYDFYTKNRDSDGDGLLEWGGHAILESVRDANVAVWDEVGWPSNFESVDLNCMMVMEAKSLEQMAVILGKSDEAKSWKTDHQTRNRLINETFWDEENGFFYNVNKSDNSFTFKSPDDLKRDEIIGFLPLWAGVVDDERAQKLVAKLTDPNQFWRKYGIPSLSAQDSYYNDKGYWNGPVWVEWNYLIFRGLQDYGYREEAAELTDRISAVMISQLKQNHNLWEFHSPDEDWAGYHKTYIWAGIINRMLMDRGLGN
jgi:hypothetical protein